MLREAAATPNTKRTQRLRGVCDRASNDCVMGGPRRNEVLKRDCAYICDKLPVVVMLSGWRKSLGATMEHSLSKALGLEILYKRERKQQQNEN